MSGEPDIVAIGEFLATTMGVLATFGVRAAIDADRSIADSGHIAVNINARGDLRRVVWRFPVEVARFAAEQMVPGMAIDPALLEAAASELANVLTGRGLATLAAHGIEIEIEPPCVEQPPRGGVIGLLATELGTIKVVFHGHAAA